MGNYIHGSEWKGHRNHTQKGQKPSCKWAIGINILSTQKMHAHTHRHTHTHISIFGYYNTIKRQREPGKNSKLTIYSYCQL